MREMRPANTTDKARPLYLQQEHNSNSQSSSAAALQRFSTFGSDQLRSRAFASAPYSHTREHESSTSSKPAVGSSSPSASSQSRRRPSSSHSRPSSISGVRDGVANLNRWSQSTASSKSSEAHVVSNRFSRRMSLGGVGTLNQNNKTSSQSPSRSQRSRPGTAGSTTNENSPGRTIETAPQGPVLLPPIITLPPLQQAVGETTTPLTAATLTPSTAGLLTAAVKSAVPDYFEGRGDHSQDREARNGTSPIEQTRIREDALGFGGKGPDQIIQRTSPVMTSRRIDEDIDSSGRGYSRHRSLSSRTVGGSGSSRSRERNPKQPSQKAMLSKALQKANTAVLLDNAQNFAGATEAYAEACDLLQQVMVRSSGNEDKRKLEAIRNTYTSRINELEKIAPGLYSDDKALPARPPSRDDGEEEMRLMSSDYYEQITSDETATAARTETDSSPLMNSASKLLSKQSEQTKDLLLPPFKPGPFGPMLNVDSSSSRGPYSQSPVRNRTIESSISLAPPMQKEYMPSPLSPRRPLSPVKSEARTVIHDRQQASLMSESRAREEPKTTTHNRAPSNESMSWLDTIDESGDSATSSVHSRTSSMGVRRKHIRTGSGATEAEFDAALDAAVEAAYDDGFEPIEPERVHYDDNELIVNVRRRVEMARERVRQTEREAEYQLSKERERLRMMRRPTATTTSFVDDIDENESEEEERILEEMTRGYGMDDFEFGLQSKSALPRESSSSGFSGRTWNSSIGSNPATTGTSLSMVTEMAALPELPPAHTKILAPYTSPPPKQKLPRPPSATLQDSNATYLSRSRQDSPGGVRGRRLSGQNAKTLKIETATTLPENLSTSLPQLSPTLLSESLAISTDTAIRSTSIPAQRQNMNAPYNRPPIPLSSRQASSPFPGPSPSETISAPIPKLTNSPSLDNDAGTLPPRSASPGRGQSRSGIRKNFSASSLKNMKSRNVSISAADDGSDASPNTPMSSSFASTTTTLRDISGRVPAMPALPTPVATAFRDKINIMPAGGMFLFESDINFPESPSSPHPLNSGAPLSLEPCPSEYSLRPFWLMRACYQTIAHPKGGYLSTKLFIPRDVWRVKGVKIKGVEDKMSNCDYLTAALLKLSKVDTYDADAVLDEMQSLEAVLEQVQSTLSKKLGSDVGVQGMGSLFKDSGVGAEDSVSGPRSAGSSSKSAFSWRRLRSKNSGVGLTAAYSNKPPPTTSTTLATEGPREGTTMSSLPMSSAGIGRPAKRDISQVEFSGPNANYMGALARLFDAAQVIDQIARQVEDPGLRHADKTQVGLELSVRHAAEFFGFYICRFVLSDIGLLLDKFLKRGSEWVVI